MRSPCLECGAPSEHDHHVVPRSRGGTVTVPLCVECHAKAHHREGNMATNALTKAALRAKKARGERLGRPPFGLSVEDGALVPNADFPELCRGIELRLAGASLRQVAKDMSWGLTKTQRLCKRWCADGGAALKAFGRGAH